MLVQSPPRREIGEPAVGPSIEMAVGATNYSVDGNIPTNPAEDLVRLQAELNSPSEEWVPFRSSWQPSEQTWKPLAENWQQARKPPEQFAAPSTHAVLPEPPSMPAERPEPPPEARPKLRDLPRFTASAAPKTSDEIAPRTAAPVAAPIAQPDSTRPDLALSGNRVHVSALPLVWFNAAFDVFLTPLGPAGRWFKDPRGRSFLGFIGVMCLAGAIALAVADGIGLNW
jgi:hypothetical protein